MDIFVLDDAVICFLRPGVTDQCGWFKQALVQQAVLSRTSASVIIRCPLFCPSLFMILELNFTRQYHSSPAPDDTSKDKMSASSSALSFMFSSLSPVSTTAKNPNIIACGDTPLCRRCIALFQKPSKIQSKANRIITRLAALDSRGNGSEGVVFFGLQPDPRDFLEAAEKGCFICVCLKSCYGDLTWQQHIASSATWKQKCLHGFHSALNYINPGQNPPELTFRIGSIKTARRSQFQLLGVDSISEQRIRYNATAAVNTGSPETLHLASLWLRDCLAHHQSCGKLATGRCNNIWLPTRLVRITQDSARLCDREDIALPIPSYASLSHCWGKKTIFTTKKSNLQFLYQEIPLQLLPKTFRDAIAICRTLNLEYLWIDSLCIIQDSVEDWQAESKHMGKVYKYGLINIAATGFSDGQCGIFVDRDTQRIRQHTVVSQGSNFLPKGEFQLLWSSKWHSEVLAAPLNRRAWVVQERILSPRILSFGANEVFWECKERNACESYPHQFPAVDTTISNQRQFQLGNPLNELADLAGKTLHLGTRDFDKKLWQFWATVVELYSGAYLTKETDKVIAISGIVAEMKAIAGGECLAGIWKAQLLVQLLWSVPGKHPLLVSSQATCNHCSISSLSSKI